MDLPQIFDARGEFVAPSADVIEALSPADRERYVSVALAAAKLAQADSAVAETKQSVQILSGQLAAAKEFMRINFPPKSFRESCWLPAIGAK